MQIFVLRRSSVEYDEVEGVVVCACDEREARVLASEVAGDEGSEAWLQNGPFGCICKAIGSCEPQPPRVVLRSCIYG
jgi:hypothetical protein